MSRIVAPAVMVLALVVTGVAGAAPPAEAGAGVPVADAAAKKKKAKKPSGCRKGHVRRKVKVGKGKKRRTVVRCVKRRRPTKPGTTTQPGTTQPGTTEPGTTQPGQTTQPGASTPQKDDMTRFREHIVGHKISRVYASGGSVSSSSGDETYEFCRDGTSFRYWSNHSSSGGSGFSGNSYYTEGRGTWELKEAKFNPEGTVAEGRVAYTWTQFGGLVNGANDPDAKPPGGAASGEMIVTMVGANQVYLGTVEFNRQGAASC